MEHIINLHIEKLPEGVFLATSDDIQGLVAQGRTITETIEIVLPWAKKLYHPDDMPEGTLRAILKQADIIPEDFLKI